MNDTFTRFIGKLLLASLLPVGVLVGSVYFVVDTSIRGLEKSIDITNERMNDALDALAKLDDAVNDLRVAVAQLDVTTTAKLDGILKSLEKTSFESPEFGFREYSITAGMEPFSGVDGTNGSSEVLVENRVIRTAASYSPEIIAAAVQDRLTSFGTPGATLACDITFNGMDLCAAVTAGNTADTVSGSPPSPSVLSERWVLEIFADGAMSGDAPFALPVKNSFRFTSGFGIRRRSDGTGTTAHNGVDLASAYGTPIFATANGVITFGGWENGYGKRVVIQHANEIETSYSQLSEIFVDVGQRIKQGEKIGAMGNSGRSTGTHLHYEIKVAGEFVNPMAFIRAASDPASFDVVAAISNATAFAAPNDLDASPRPKSRP